MLTRVKLACIGGAIAVLAVAPTATAQSFTPIVGTGNAASCYYDQNGVLQVGSPGVEQSQLATRRGGESAFAYVPGAPADASCNPALTGGGSIGYNQKLLQD